ncbi:protein NRT1/ PTR FAMILY 7.3-like [Chenopodium quinoa]|uniref:protein NRT1/ PTR FAMILY 7.3-like n=1 Tax=Chenopodium quinoa TaxID=63459 RepID=UPI000B77B071|nr:protein NRT1/ PTR FAMILY 7.3-like [Chenopodium quinoa]
MACLNVCQKDKIIDESEEIEYTLDRTVDRYGKPAIRNKTGRWGPATLILVNQGLATLAFFGVGVNLVLFLTRVVGQSNADAANNVSKWTGTVYLFSLFGAFLSDSYWGRYKTCTIFQAIFVVGLALLSLSSYLFLLKPRGCGDELTPCTSHSGFHVPLFYISLYMVALGNGGYQPNIATFGADQFDVEHPKERGSKISFFSFFYLAFNLGSLFSNTLLAYYENDGKWAIGFFASAITALLALALFLGGTPHYRHFKSLGNPISRVGKVVVVTLKKWKVRVPPQGDGLYELDANTYAKNGRKKILHTEGLTILDKAAVITSSSSNYDEKRLCTVTQVEEVKCILRLLPIWVCTIMYSVVFTQMASLFVEQGAAMKVTIGSRGFRIPPASMSVFDILSVASFIFIYRRVLNPIVIQIRKRGLTELERMGIGLILAFLAMVTAGVVEVYRLKYAKMDCNNDCDEASSLSIFWQIPQFMFIGASEVFMYVGQLEFFNGQAPKGLKSFGSALCMLSMSFGNYMSSIIVTILMKITARGSNPGWIPEDLNKGHLERFYFLLAILTTIDFMLYLYFASTYKYVQCQDPLQGENDDDDEESAKIQV